MAIKRRTAVERAEIELSGNLVMSKSEWLARGGISHGTKSQAYNSGWFTVRWCEILGQPVTEDEFANVKDFCIYVGCYQKYFVKHNGIKQLPCLPVFFREKNKGSTEEKRTDKVY